MPSLPLTIQQMTGNPFLPGDPFTTPIPQVRRSASQADVRKAEPPLTPAEIQEAQRLGILPAAPAPSANVGQVSAPVQADPGRTSPPPAARAPSPVRRGAGVVPRVQLDPAAAPPSPLSQSIAAQRGQYNTQLDKVSGPTDYTQLSRQMQDRSRAGMDDMYASVLAGLGPSAVHGLQEPLLKNALAARSPMKVEGGMIDENGRVMIDPAFQKNKIADQLRNRLLQLDQLEAKVGSDQEKAALAHERNLIMLMMQQMRVDMNQNNQSASTYGFTPDGRRIVENRQGVQFVENPDGSLTRYMGPSTPKAAYEKNIQGAMGLQGNVNRLDALIGLAQKNPEAFGLAAAATSFLPDIAQQRVMPKVLTPEQMVARNYIQRQAADEIHQIYGAALTMGEGHRASQWAIGPRDSVETVMSKLQAARDWAAQTMIAQGVAPNAAAQGRVNPGNVPPTPQGPSVPAGMPPSSGQGLPPGWGYREGRR